MDFYEAIKTRRSIRSYKPDPVPDEKLNRVLEAARVAPSGSNRQPWRFIVIRDEELKRRLVPACGGQQFISEAPVVIAVCGQNIHYNRGGYMEDMSMLVDVSIAFTHLVLAARVEGLGTCWIGLFDNARVKTILNVPPEYNVVALTPLGYPKDDQFSDQMSRRPLSEIVSIDNFQ